MKGWVAIDFGSSYSSATIMVGGQPQKVHPIGGLYNMYGFPTIAYVSENKDIKVCNEALAWRAQNPERFIKDFKLSICEEPITHLGIKYEDIICNILTTIKKSAEIAQNNETVNSAIITYPSSYSDVDPRIDIMKRSAEQAGFETIRFIKEAEAAAIYYDKIIGCKDGSLTLIYDLGGGTFDTAIIQHNEGDYRLLGNSSGTICGGQQFESLIYKHLNKKYGFNYSEDENLRFMQINTVADLCKNIKEELSIHTQVKYPVPLLGKMVVELDRETFNSLISPLIERTFQECSSLVHSSGKTWQDIKRVVMIGGSCAIPVVKDLLAKYLIGQNAVSTEIILNKSENGEFIDSLFAVSIGAMYSLLNDSTTINNVVLNDQPPSPVESPSLDTIDFLASAIALDSGDGIEQNRLLACFFYNLEYCTSRNEEAKRRQLQIYEALIDSMEICDGGLAFDNTLKEMLGEDAIDLIIEHILILQQDFDNMGYNTFIVEIADLDYWISLTKKCVLKLYPSLIEK